MQQVLELLREQRNLRIAHRSNILTPKRIGIAMVNVCQCVAQHAHEHANAVEQTLNA